MTAIVALICKRVIESFSLRSDRFAPFARLLYQSLLYPGSLEYKAAGLSHSTVTTNSTEQCRESFGGARAVLLLATFEHG